MPRRAKTEANTLAKDAGVAAPKEELRRIRNRLSQRAIRERRAIRLQLLEQQLAATRETEADSRFDDLQAECEKLREGLLSVRKKLLSISTTSSSVADGIRSLLDLGPAKGAFEEDEEKPDVVLLEGNVQPPSPTRSRVSSSTEEVHTEAANSRDTLPKLFDGSQQEPTDQTPFSFFNTDLNGFGPKLDVSNCFEQNSKRKPEDDIWNSPWPDSSIVEQDFTTFSGLAESSGMDIDIATSQLTSQAILSLAPPKRRSLFSDHLDYVHKLIRLSGIGENFTRPPPIMHSLLHAFITSSWPKMNAWFTTTNSCVNASALLWWQATRSPQSFIDIPGIHSPTPSQMVLSYPSIIDWIPHGRIRDLMVMNYPMFDVDRLICDMTDAYVIEDDDGSEPSSLMEMVQRYSTPASEIHVDSYFSHYDHPPSNFISSNQIQHFKIDPSFFVRYPSLYDATAIAKRACRSICIHERDGPPNPPVELDVAAAERYLDVMVQGRMKGWSSS